MISIELPVEDETELAQRSAREHLTQAEIIRKALRMYFVAARDQAQTANAYELGKDLFGKYGSQQGNLSQQYKTLLKEKLHGKHAH